MAEIQKSEEARKVEEIKEAKKEYLSDEKRNPAKKKSKIDAQREKDLKMVKGMFKNNEQPGGILKFPFKKYKEVDLKYYHFTDGQVYTVPYMIAQHINKNCSYPVHEHYRGESLNPESGKSEYTTSVRVGTRTQRFSFIPLDFIEENDSRIITVERV